MQGHVNGWRQNVQPAGLQPMNMQPAGLQPMNMQPAGLQPMNMQPMGVSPMEAQPMNMQPMGVSPMEAQPMNMQPMGVSPMETQPMNMQPTGLQPMGMQPQGNPMITMPEQQLESMYPNVYNIINPVVEDHCDKMEMKYGTKYCPTKEQVEAEAENIAKEVQKDVDTIIEKDAGAAERQLGFGGRRILRDLAAILFIRSLIGRRRPYGYYPGYYPGYVPGFYPGYYPGYSVFPLGGYYGY